MLFSFHLCIKHEVHTSIVKEECQHILTNNETSLKSMQSSIQSDGQFIHPVIRLFTATLNPSIYNNPKSVLSSRRTVFFLGGFVFVAATVVVQTQHTDIDFLGGLVFVAFGEPNVGVSF